MNTTPKTRTPRSFSLEELLGIPANDPGRTRYFRAGLCLVAISLTLNLLVKLGVLGSPTQGFAGPAVALGSFIMAFFYGVSLINARRFSIKKHPELVGFCLLLGWVAFFALNELVGVFNKAAPWLTWAHAISLGLWLVLPLAHQLGKYGRRMAWVLFGIAITLFGYYTVILIPIYPLSLLATLLLGVGFTAFIPGLTLLLSIWYAFAQKREYPHAFKFIAAGAAASLLFAAAYTGWWYTQANRLEDTITQHELPPFSEVPLWVHVAQHAPRDAISKQVLEEDVRYPKAVEWFGPDFLFPNINRRSGFRHNPLVTVAQQTHSLSRLERADRILILNALYGSQRHAMENRLWRGNDLVHRHIETHVDLYPAHRLAYTEKTLEIAHKGHENTWFGRQQEAIYTLDLPEGAVVSSLHLWIDGEARPAHLTTKAKAENAYNTIVGRELRDPSVVHWKEGNQVSLRVFPVTPDMPRTVRIGITSPLAYRQGELVYETFTIKGVANGLATDHLSVNVIGAPDTFATPEGFRHQNGQYVATAKPWARWSFSLPAPPLSQEAFEYNGKAYQLRPATMVEEAVDLKAIYLDLNRHWTATEVEQVLKAYADLPLYAYDANTGAMEQVNSQEPAALYAQAQQLNFSLFPFHQIPQPQQALLITKSGTYSPNWEELRGTAIGSSLKAMLCQERPIRTYALAAERSPYLRTATEFGLIKVSTLTANAIGTRNFNHARVQPNEVLIPQAGMVVQALDEPAPENSPPGPDHLFRLYAYGKMLQQSAHLLDSGQAVTEDNIALAHMANIVSPVSSLVVLENKEDYERFDIKDRGGLGNAALREGGPGSSRSGGSTPAPEMWLLMILLAAGSAFFAIKRLF